MVLSVTFSCAVKTRENKNVPEDVVEDLNPEVDLAKLQSDFRLWWSYYNNHIDLNGEFTALDKISEQMDKTTFLKQLNT
mgnify:CR=1 FL=1